MAEMSRRGASSLSGTVKDQSAETYKLLIGEYLLKAGHITRGQLEEGTKWLKSHPDGFLSVFLLKKNYIESSTVSTVLSRQYNFPTINLAEREVSPEVSGIISYEVAKKYMAIPYNKKDNKLYLAMLEPTNSKHVDELTALTKHQLMLGVAPYESIVDAFSRGYGISEEEYKSFLAPLDPKDIEDSGPMTVDNLGALISDALDDFAFGDTGEDDTLSAEMYSAENSTIINLANQILLQAISEGASDIHIEPFEKQFYVRYRIDGALYKRTRLPLEIKNALIARLKIMSKLDITERRVPQDGRIKLRISRSREIDFRVSSLPTLFGESVVLRILDKSGLNVDLTKLGFTQKNLEQVQGAIYRPNGMFLVTGPTGSGKTVTLYSCLSLRNTDDVKILTAEDPVEFNFSGVNQVNVIKEVGMTFAKALKAFLRQDPDICMIGEIRDLETGEIAVEASMTGHLVLSTLHTNDAPSTVTRLIDMGVPSFNVSAALVLCSAQRLLRKICPNCKQAVNKMPANKLIEAGFSSDEVASIQLYEGKGCPICKGSGYKGRLGAFEIMEATPVVGEAIASNVPEAQLRKIAMKEGMATLRQDGLLKAAQGLTTLAQVLEKTVLQKESLPHYLLNPDELTFTNDDVIIKEGSSDTNFYKLIQGTLGVYKGQTQIAEISDRNAFFGEMSALMGGTRSATIKSQGKSIVKMFPGDKLMEVIEGYPDIAKSILVALVDRLSNANVRLSSYMHDKAELERTYIAQLTASTSTAAPRPIASSPTRRSASLAKAVAGVKSASAKSIITTEGHEETSVTGSTIASSKTAPSGASPTSTGLPRPVATSPTATNLPRPVATSPAATGMPRPAPASPAATGMPRPAPASPAATSMPRPAPASPAATSTPRPMARPARLSQTPGGVILPERFTGPDVTRLLTTKNMSAAAPATIRVVSNAPKARELKSV